MRTAGPWPFTTQRVYQQIDQSLVVWRSRDDRKHLATDRADRIASVVTLLRRGLWLPQTLNWWIGLIFALGAFLFALGSVLSLSPHLAQRWAISSNSINVIYFAGSIPFTTAAYLQLFQAANAAPRSRRRRSPVWFGWFPHNIGWLSCALQFPGTLLFNLNTWDAMVPGLTWVQQDLIIWAPDFVGSVLFLASGYLGFIETCHAYWAWKPSSLSWWITFANLLGCIGFMIAAVYALVLPRPLVADAVTLATTFTLLGAVFFFMGSLLMLPEAARSANQP
ncbi:hypothetical protein E1H13_18075 [Nodosilinea sp. P-1105]|nr:hypothetical protein [Nodosilinea sp. P-1105]